MKGIHSSFPLSEGISSSVSVSEPYPSILARLRDFWEESFSMHWRTDTTDRTISLAGETSLHPPFSLSSTTSLHALASKKCLVSSSPDNGRRYPKVRKTNAMQLRAVLQSVFTLHPPWPRPSQNLIYSTIQYPCLPKMPVPLNNPFSTESESEPQKKANLLGHVLPRPI